MLELLAMQPKAGEQLGRGRRWAEVVALGSGLARVPVLGRRMIPESLEQGQGRALRRVLALDRVEEKQLERMGPVRRSSLG